GLLGHGQARPIRRDGTAELPLAGTVLGRGKGGIQLLRGSGVVPARFGGLRLCAPDAGHRPRMAQPRNALYRGWGHFATNTCFKNPVSLAVAEVELRRATPTAPRRPDPGRAGRSATPARRR